MSASIATGLTITNPLVKYRALVATKAISPDNGQLRLALHLQKVYDRLKDYEPEIEYSQQLDQISRAINPDHNGRNTTSEPMARRTAWGSFFAEKQKRDSLALTRRLTSHESAMQLDSPKGLMLHGEVGTGKSMLIDLFADCLPNRKKRRWHFNTFMLETFAKLESYRRDSLLRSSALSVPNANPDDYSLMWLAKDLVQTSPIVFLDEFQMPDRVASKILTNLMTSFFHLGGVLIATSNRMPEELAKASGIDFQPRPSPLQSLRQSFGLGASGKRSSGRNEFAAFLDVLRMRCEVWEMEGGQDYRRVGSGSVAPVRLVDEVGDEWQLDGQDDLVNISTKVSEETTPEPVQMPKFYEMSSENELNEHVSYETVLRDATADPTATPSAFTPGFMKVYGRTIPVPRAYKGVTEWTFEELCKSCLGPADYITLASTYHTVILRDVPVLTISMKNEARRFITLLDALYECRCKLFIQAVAGPDDLFFPDKKGEDEEETDAVYSETFSEAYQDATAPFRPNILTENPNYAEPDPEPDYTHARLAGLLRADSLEDDSPHQGEKQRKPFGRSFGFTDSEMERKPVDPDEPRYIGRGPNFSKASSFTGEDERFAYKRAQSRLWELCGARWWARDEEGWHRPLPADVRRWEVSINERKPTRLEAAETGDVQAGDAAVDSSRDVRSFRWPGKAMEAPREPAPKIATTHFWGTGLWGPRAGAWGKGVDGLQDREKESKAKQS